ncbi:MAG: MBL fold metallo-hydrolase [Clostridia bacterium]|nr:MBL fold metallo-hydrolase [Clostridia bacterium]
MIRFQSIVSGSSGNCTLICSNKTKILIDCGISGKKITAYLNDMGINPCEIDRILVTHEHIDHTNGVGILSRKFNIPIVASEGTWEGMEIGKIPDENRIVFGKSQPLEIGDIKITPFDIPHDAMQPTGYVMEYENKKFAVATDIGHITDSVVRNLVGCDAILLESNYDDHMLQTGPYPMHLKRRIAGAKGHLANKDAGTLAIYLAKNGTRQIMLGHLSNENNSPEIAFSEVARELEFGGLQPGKDIMLSVAPRYDVSENMFK